jgi:hypothetical protein
MTFDEFLLKWLAGLWQAVASVQMHTFTALLAFARERLILDCRMIL